MFRSRGLRLSSFMVFAGVVYVLFFKARREDSTFRQVYWPFSSGAVLILRIQISNLGFNFPVSVGHCACRSFLAAIARSFHRRDCYTGQWTLAILYRLHSDSGVCEPNAVCHLRKALVPNTLVITHIRTPGPQSRPRCSKYIGPQGPTYKQRSDYDHDPRYGVCTSYGGAGT